MVDEAIIKSVQNYLRTLIAQGRDIRFGVIFGSFATGCATEWSDIDLLVEFGEDVTLFDFVDLQDSLSEILGKKVCIVSRRGLSKYIGPYILKEAEAIGEGTVSATGLQSTAGYLKLFSVRLSGSTVRYSVKKRLPKPGKTSQTKGKKLVS